MSGVFLWAFMLLLHVRHLCWGQPQLVLLSGISTSSSPWEKTECWLYLICQLLLPSSRTLLDAGLWCSFFADLPPDRRGESCPHIGILGARERKSSNEVVQSLGEVHDRLSKYSGYLSRHLNTEQKYIGYTVCALIVCDSVWTRLWTWVSVYRSGALGSSSRVEWFEPG